jgi:hypothetical protein
VIRLRTVMVALFALVLFAATACGDDDSDGETTTAPVDQTSDDETDDDDDADDGANGDGPAEEPAGGGGGGGGGELVFGDETVEFDRALCYLQEQPVAGSDGTILLTAQGHGTTAAGEPVVVDFTRYDEESMFTGDDISVDFGDPFGDDFEGYMAGLDLGAVAQDGDVLSADDVSFMGDDGTEVVGSFRIEC